MTKTPSTDRKAYIITGPTSGIGYATALELAKHGTLVLVGRDRAKLEALRKTLAKRGQEAVFVVCDLADTASIQRAAMEIVALKLPIAGVLNNAGIMQSQPKATQNPLGWDMSFATNHVGPFVLTEALVPYLGDGTNVLFVASAVEDPERKPAVAAGFRGGRYISAEASARGEWKAGGSTKPGMDAYATSKQATLVTALAFARETPRLHFHAVEPGFTPATSLSRDAGPGAQIAMKYIVPLLVPLLMPFIKILSTPKRSARMLTKLITDTSGKTGIYYDEGGQPMRGSAQVHDPQFQDRVVAETRALLRSSGIQSAPKKEMSK